MSLSERTEKKGRISEREYTGSSEQSIEVRSSERNKSERMKRLRRMQREEEMKSEDRIRETELSGISDERFLPESDEEGNY